MARATDTGTAVTSQSQRADSLGVDTGTFRIRGARRPDSLASLRIISAYVSDSGPPASKIRPHASGTPGRRTR